MIGRHQHNQKDLEYAAKLERTCKKTLHQSDMLNKLKHWNCKRIQHWRSTSCHGYRALVVAAAPLGDTTCDSVVSLEAHAVLQRIDAVATRLIWLWAPSLSALVQHDFTVWENMKSVMKICLTSVTDDQAGWKWTNTCLLWYGNNMWYETSKLNYIIFGVHILYNNATWCNMFCYTLLLLQTHNKTCCAMWHYCIVHEHQIWCNSVC